MDYINFPTALCVNHSMASLKLRGVVPHSREEALLMMQSYWRCRMALATAGGNEPKGLELTANMFFGAFAAVDFELLALVVVFSPPFRGPRSRACLVPPRSSEVGTCPRPPGPAERPLAGPSLPAVCRWRFFADALRRLARAGAPGAFPVRLRSLSRLAR